MAAQADSETGDTSSQQEWVDLIQKLQRNDPHIQCLCKAFGDTPLRVVFQDQSESETLPVTDAAEAVQLQRAASTKHSEPSPATTEVTVTDRPALTTIGNFEPSSLRVICRPCSSDGFEGKLVGFFGLDGDEPVITLCTNRLESEEHVRNIVAHELTHAYDYCVRKWDFSTKMRHLACSEVRAARNGECHDTTNALFGFFRRWCTRWKARASTRNMFPNGGQIAVDSVFDKCYGDVEPKIAEPSSE